MNKGELVEAVAKSANITKLAARYPEGFSPGASADRRDERA